MPLTAEGFDGSRQLVQEFTHVRKFCANRSLESVQQRLPVSAFRIYQLEVAKSASSANGEQMAHSVDTAYAEAESTTIPSLSIHVIAKHEDQLEQLSEMFG